MRELTLVLYVEDDPDIQMVAQMALEVVGGLALRSCSSGQEALAAVATSSPDLILLDVMMPDMDGYEVLRGLKDNPASHNVPVIFITAFPERLLTGTRPEPTFLITKPFQRATVKAAIAQALFFDAATVPAG